MPRRTRIFIPGGYYHVYCRVARGEFVFDNPSEVERWIDVVSGVSRIHGLKLLAWALMSNHYHLVVRSGSTPLWAAMAKMQGRYARAYNRERGFLGRLWQSRYKARLLIDGEDLKCVIAYVHLNPVAAGVVEDPLAYPSSGHREVMGLEHPRLCDVPACLLCFDEDELSARVVYLRWLRAVAEARWFKKGVRELPWWRTAGDDEQTIPTGNEPPESVDFADQPVAPEPSTRPPLQRVLEVFERDIGVAPGDLSGRLRTTLLAQHRRLFATFAVSWLGHTAKDVAGVLDKSRGAVSGWISEGLALQLTELSFRKRLERLASLLVGHKDGPGM